jgi:VanZ family protein
VVCHVSNPSEGLQTLGGKILNVTKLTAALRWAPSLFLMALIFYVSSLPATDIPDLGWADVVAKKIGHALGFGLLSITYLCAISTQLKRPKRYWLAWLLTVAYGLTDEFHQSFVPSRNASLLDVGIDAAGAAIILRLLYYYYSNSSSKSSP